MMNYIWAGLLIGALGFALYRDGGDLASDTYRNGEPVPAVIEAAGSGPEATAADDADEEVRLPVRVRLSASALAEHFGVDPPPNAALPDAYEARLVETDGRTELRFDPSATFPEPLATIAEQNRLDSGQVMARVEVSAEALRRGEPVSVGLRFEAVRFRALQNMMEAAFDRAEWAAQYAIGLTGLLALWLGLMKIAEDARLIDVFVRLVRPVLGRLFPEVPRDHPALGMIALNLAANMLGLGNAATPLGLKAMEELQKLNPTEDTATNSMCMLLAMNTASVTLMPPATLIAILGLAAFDIFIPILIVTGLSLIVAIFAARTLQRLPVFVRSDPGPKREPSREASSEPTEGGAS